MVTSSPTPVRRAAEAAAFALLLGGCAAAEERFSAAQTADLAEETAGRVPGAPVDCVDGRASLRIAGGALIASSTRGVWVNANDRRCPVAGIDPLIIVEPQIGSDVCRNDQFRTLARGSSIAGPTCRVMAWVPYTKP